MLIISVTEQSSKFHYVYWDMTTGLLINVHCLSSLVTHESWVNFDRISLLPCPAQFQGIWGGGFEQVHLGFIRFSQKLVRVLGQEENLPWAHRCNKLHSTICIVLLSEFVSRKAWLQHLPSAQDGAGKKTFQLPSFGCYLTPNSIFLQRHEFGHVVHHL